MNRMRLPRRPTKKGWSPRNDGFGWWDPCSFRNRELRMTVLLLDKSLRDSKVKSQKYDCGFR